MEDPARESDHRDADPIVYYGFIFITVASFITNTIVFCIVLKKYWEGKCGRRNVSVLIAHLAIVAFLVPFLNCFVSSDVFHIIEFDSSKCQLVSYLKTVALCSYTVNMIAIVLELVVSFRRGGFSADGFRLFQAFCVLWIIPIFFSIPSWWMIQPKDVYIQNLVRGRYLQNLTVQEKIQNITEHCVPVTLMDSEAATLAYESTRLFLCYAVVTFCMIAAVFYIRSQINFLRQLRGESQTDQIQSQFRSVRLLYFYFSTVIFLWLPCGIIVFCRKILPRLVVNDRSAEKRNTFWKIFSTFAVLAYVSLCPLISMIFIEVRHNYSWSLVSSRIISTFRRSAGKDTTANGTTSRYSTIGFTTAVNAAPIPDRQSSLEEIKTQVDEEHDTAAN